MRNQQLWQRLCQFNIDDGPAERGFADRLSHEQGWSQEYTRRVINEYKRFLYLAMTANHEVTPSKAVDEAWHLHLTYTRSYWDRLCGQVLGRPLHHNPSTGSIADTEKYAQQYQRTLASYEAAFGTSPPEDIWPNVRPPEIRLQTYQLAYLGGGMTNVTATALTRLHELGMIECDQQNGNLYRRTVDGLILSRQVELDPVELTAWNTLATPASFGSVAQAIKAQHEADLIQQLIGLKLMTKALTNPVSQKIGRLMLYFAVLGTFVWIGSLVLALFGLLQMKVSPGLVALFLFVTILVAGFAQQATYRLRRTQRGERVLHQSRHYAQLHWLGRHSNTDSADIVAVMGVTALSAAVYTPLLAGMPNETLIRRRETDENKKDSGDGGIDFELADFADDAGAACGVGDFGAGCAAGADGGGVGGAGCGGGCGGGD